MVFLFFSCFSKHDGYIKSIKPSVLFKVIISLVDFVFILVLKTCNCLYYGECNDNDSCEISDALYFYFIIF